mmetsp:Transcript_4271/g.15963  ORF Transcript_4271/g.15963 Transcript_4271/m.15963 type:complete len:278 (+) Transcript_4271:4206-5039(+)
MDPIPDRAEAWWALHSRRCQVGLGRAPLENVAATDDDRVARVRMPATLHRVATAVLTDGLPAIRASLGLNGQHAANQLLLLGIVAAPSLGWALEAGQVCDGQVFPRILAAALRDDLRLRQQRRPRLRLHKAVARQFHRLLQSFAGAGFCTCPADQGAQKQFPRGRRPLFKAIDHLQQVGDGHVHIGAASGHGADQGASAQMNKPMPPGTLADNREGAAVMRPIGLLALNNPQLVVDPLQRADHSRVHTGQAWLAVECEEQKVRQGTWPCCIVACDGR